MTDMTPDQARHHIGALLASLQRPPAEHEKWLAGLGDFHRKRQAEAKHAAAHAPLNNLVKALIGKGIIR